MERNNVTSFMFIKPIGIINDSNFTFVLPNNAYSHNLRSDNKLNVYVDTQGIINNKCEFINITYPKIEKIRVPETVFYFNNDKSLEKSISKVFTLLSSYDYRHGQYIISYLLKEFISLDSEYIKCEIFSDDIVNKHFNITIDSTIDSIYRYYIRFTPCNKKNKENINIKYIQKKGFIRLFEYIFDINSGKEQAREI